MSRPLEYPAKCERCAQLMASGTEADFFRDGGAYRYTHAGDECPAPTRPVRLRPSFDVRVCPDPTCYAGNPGYAFRKGTAPPRCHICGKPWLDELVEAA